MGHSGQVRSEEAVQELKELGRLPLLGRWREAALEERVMGRQLSAEQFAWAERKERCGARGARGNGGKEQ